MQRPFSCDMVYVSIHIVHRFAYDPLDIFQSLRILVLIHHGLCLIKIAFVTDQNNFGIIQPRPCSPGTLCSPKKKCVIVLDGGAIRNADKIVLMQIDQQAGCMAGLFCTSVPDSVRSHSPSENPTKADKFLHQIPFSFLFIQKSGANLFS